MAKEILANVEPFEVRVAVLEQGVLTGVLFERGEPVAGNIYKGRVASVLPGMEAAFVDIGLDRNAFLHFADIRAQRIADLGGEDDDALEDQIGRGAVITERLRVGQEILVQVSKEPRGSKGARATTYVALPAHYLVLTPTVPGIGVSRKITDDAERKRLRSIADRLRPEGMGLIVRTAAEGVDEQDLADDVRFLLQLWGRVTERARGTRAPAVLYQDLGLIRRVVRDLFTGDVDRFVVDSAAEYERIRDLIGSFAPGLRDRVVLHEGPGPVFEGIEQEIERALHRKVWLRSGGYVVFDRTEAATVIDVNTGKYVGKTDLASTILKTNLEATREIARQIRLRDIGGIILVDFIDMESEKHRRQVLDALHDAVRGDRAKAHVIDLTELGLVELTRKRVYQDLEELMRIPCPYCEGRGRVLSPPSVAVRLRRELRRQARAARARYLVAEVHPEVAALLDQDSAWREELERASGVAILIRATAGIHLDRVAIRQADSPEAAERQIAARDHKTARAFWLDPVRGEGLELPDEDEVVPRPALSGEPAGSAGRGRPWAVFGRAWAWLRAALGAPSGRGGRTDRDTRVSGSRGRPMDAAMDRETADAAGATGALQPAEIAAGDGARRPSGEDPRDAGARPAAAEAVARGHARRRRRSRGRRRARSGERPAEGG